MEYRDGSASRWAGRRPGRDPHILSHTARFYFSRKPPGDLDNYLKAVADGLMGIAYRDDRQVAEVAAQVLRCPPGEERMEVELGQL